MGSTVHQGYHRCWISIQEGSTGKQECVGYIDSDYAGGLDKHWSITGYVFTLSQVPVS